MLRLSGKAVRLTHPLAAMNRLPNSPLFNQSQALSSAFDETSIPAVGEPAAFILDDSHPISKQIQFDDDMDSLFASMPAEQLDRSYYAKVANETKAAGPSRQEIIDVDEYDSVYEEDSELDDIFASVDENILIPPPRANCNEAKGTSPANKVVSIRDLTHSPPHSPVRTQTKIRGTYNKWTAQQPIRFDDDEAPRHMSALQKDILNTLNPVRINESSKPAKPSTVAKSRNYSTVAAPSKAASSSHPVVPPKAAKKDSASYAAKAAMAKDKELQKQKLEAGLSIYSYLRPAGTIESMRKHGKEVQDDLASIMAQTSGPSSSEVVVCTHRSPRLQTLSDAKEMEQELQAIKGGQIISFDMEWPVTRRSKVQHKTSVIQIASASDIYILQVGTMQSLPRQLLRIIQDTSIIKCGVAIRMDAIKLRKDFGEEATMTNMVELSYLAKHVDVNLWKNVWHLISLRDLCRIYLKRRLRKDDSIRAGPWGRPTLDLEQTTYAASDAYVGLEILYSIAAMVPCDNSKDFGGLFEREEVKNAIKKSSCVPLTKEKSIVEGEREMEEMASQASQASMGSVQAGELQERVSDKSVERVKTSDTTPRGRNLSSKVQKGNQPRPERVREVKETSNLNKDEVEEDFSPPQGGFFERISSMFSSVQRVLTSQPELEETNSTSKHEIEQKRRSSGDEEGDSLTSTEARSMYRSVPLSEIKLVNEEWGTGTSISVLARKYGLHTSSVSYFILKSLSLEGRQLNDEEKRRIVHMMRYGSNEHLRIRFKGFLDRQDIELENVTYPKRVSGSERGKIGSSSEVSLD